MEKKTCVDCHFFFKESDRHKFVISEDSRDKCRNGNFTWRKASESLGCYHGVWDQGVQPLSVDLENEIRHKKREGFCFFWRHRPGMLFQAATVLQKRESEATEASLDRRLTIGGLWIAGIGLLINGLVALWSMLMG